MKILHISWTFTFGGIETMLVNIANEQVKLGHDVNILIIEYNNVEKTLLEKLDPKVKMHYANRKHGAKDILSLIKFNIMLRKINPDTIHIHSAAIYKYIFGKKMRSIINSTLHALCGTKNISNIEKIPRVFAISQAVHDDLLQKKRVNSIVCANGIKPELIKPRTDITPKDYVKIVQVSRLDISTKGQDVLVSAAKELVNRGYMNFSVNFIGDGGSRALLEQQVKDLNLENFVHFIGAKSQEYIFSHLCDYDLFVQPSRNEGFGLTVAEAMAAKVPVIATSNQGPAEVINYGELGYLFEIDNVKDCADKIEIFLRKENDINQIERAYKKVWDTYNIKTTVRTYLKNYLRKDE